MAESTRSTHAKWTSSLVVAVEYGGCRFIIWIGCSVHRGHGRRPTARAAAILGSDTARRIFHVESIIQDPNVQELIREWEDKGHAKGLAKGRAEGRTKGRVEGRAAEARSLLRKVLAARSFPVTPGVRARIDREPDVARLESWLEAAVTARVIGDVFRDG